jgi:ABC-2 type transport system ATP-binding protein
VRDVIRELKADGACVFLNSHLLGEVELTCDRVAFVKDGAVVRAMALDAAERDLEVEMRLDHVTSGLVEGLAAFGRDVRAEGTCIRLRVDDESLLPDLSRWLAAQGVGIFRLGTRRSSLEEVFLEVVG